MMASQPTAIPGLISRGLVQGETAWAARWFGDDPATAAALVAAIPVDGGLEFRDSGYFGAPAADATLDDGAMVFVYRPEVGELQVTCGNHGWSSDWHPVTAARLAAFLFECRIWHRPAGDPRTTDDLRLFVKATYRPEGRQRRGGNHPLQRPR